MNRSIVRLAGWALLVAGLSSPALANNSQTVNVQVSTNVPQSFVVDGTTPGSLTNAITLSYNPVTNAFDSTTRGILITTSNQLKGVTVLWSGADKSLKGTGSNTYTIPLSVSFKVGTGTVQALNNDGTTRLTYSNTDMNWDPATGTNRSSMDMTVTAVPPTGTRPNDDTYSAQLGLTFAMTT